MIENTGNSGDVEFVLDDDDDRSTVPFLPAVDGPPPRQKPRAGIIEDGKRHRSLPWTDTRRHLQPRSGGIWDRYDVRTPARTQYRNPSAFATAGLKGLVVVLIGLTAFCSAFTWGYR